MLAREVLYRFSPAPHFPIVFLAFNPGHISETLPLFIKLSLDTSPVAERCLFPEVLTVKLKCYPGQDVDGGGRAKALGRSGDWGGSESPHVSSCYPVPVAVQSESVDLASVFLIKFQKRFFSRGWRCGSVVECLPVTKVTLSSIPELHNKTKQKLVFKCF